MKRFWPILLLAFSFFSKGNANHFPEDFESAWAQDFILEVKKIEIPGYPYAFNPSIVRWKNAMLLSFRIIPCEKFPFTSYIGLIWLDENFTPKGPPHILSLRDPFSLTPQRAEDARLIVVNEKLFIVYSDNPYEKITRGGFRVYTAEIQVLDQNFLVKNVMCLSQFDGESSLKREKNWVPFDYKGNLLLSYSITPHKVFIPSDKGICHTLASTEAFINWEWGELRGGTTALLIGKEYLSFFHSSLHMASNYSQGKKIPHYFIGAYTFQADPPFSITGLSIQPIVGRGFYQGMDYKPYWKPVRVVFPCGYVIDSHSIWLAYGRQDHEIWIAKIDKAKLLKSLTRVFPKK